MKNIENYVLLAEVSYSDFSKLDLPSKDGNKTETQDAIMKNGDKKDESKSGLAAYVSDKYTVVRLSVKR